MDNKKITNEEIYRNNKKLIFPKFIYDDKKKEYKLQ